MNNTTYFRQKRPTTLREVWEGLSWNNKDLAWPQEIHVETCFIGDIPEVVTEAIEWFAEHGEVEGYVEHTAYFFVEEKIPVLIIAQELNS
jgi:hypothetical protein